MDVSDTHLAVDVEEQYSQTLPRDFIAKVDIIYCLRKRKAAKYYFEGEPIPIFLDITQTTQAMFYVS